MTAAKLDFLAVGPQRTGTSWLDAVLRQHPQVQLPVKTKETFFFDEHFALGTEWYQDLFPAPRPDVVVGEVGPTYFDHPVAVQRIHQAAPCARIVVTLRDPIDRALSLLRHHQRKGRVPGDIRRAARLQPKILSAGHYARHVPTWQRAFGSDRVLVLVAEELEEDPQRSLDAITGFLGVQRLAVPRVADEQIGSARHVPRYPTVAKWSWRAARGLRNVGLHDVVEWGKRVGLRRLALVPSKTVQPADLHARDRAWMRELYRQDVDYVADLLGRSPKWPSCTSGAGE